MKKKIITLLLAGSLVLSNSAIAFAAETPAEETTTTVVAEETTNETEAVKTDVQAKASFNYVENAGVALADKNGVIIDIRNNSKFNDSHLRNSEHIALFDEKNTLPASLHKDFVNHFNTQKAKYNEKKIYILCNAGKMGAEAAFTALVEECGYNAADLAIITGGAGAAGNYMDYYVSNQAALDAYWGKTATIIDLRSQDSHNAGHLERFVYLPVFAKGDALVGEEADALAATFKAEIAKYADKPIYVLCYSGNRGAQKAVDLACEAGLKRDQVKIITDGIGKANPNAPFATAAKTQYVTGEKALADLAAKNATVLDLRPYAEYEKSHLKGATWLPIFPLDDESLVGKMQAKAPELIKAGKPVYVLCYTGNKGAYKATKTLLDAGVTNVYTISGGAAGAEVTAASHYVADTLAVNPGKDGLVLDVRNAELYAKGHLAGSLSLPVFDVDNKLDTEVALAAQEAFVKYVKEHQKDLAGKTIYVLCNSGNRGADLATELLAKEGITNVFTIEGGAQSTLIQSKFVKDGGQKPTPETKPEVKPGTETPKTGDTTNAIPYAVAMGAAILALVSRKKFF